MGPRIIRKMAEAIAPYDGEAYIEDFDVDAFTPEKALANLEALIKEKNSESSCYMKVINSESYAYELIENSEDSTDYGYDEAKPWDYIQFLKDNGYILKVIGATVDGWRESCAYHDLYIYLKNGTLINITYDFTT